MGLDIRIPLGLLFLVVGALLAAFGLFTHADPHLYARTMGIDLNLWWGTLMFLFGLVMFVVGRRQKWQDDPVTPRPWERDITAKRKR